MKLMYSQIHKNFSLTIHEKTICLLKCFLRRPKKHYFRNEKEISCVTSSGVLSLNAMLKNKQTHKLSASADIRLHNSKEIQASE